MQFVLCCGFGLSWCCKMNEKVALKQWYFGKYINIVVNDIDKVNLIDLVIEYLDKAEQNGVEHPKYPTFVYVHKMRHVNLNTDKDMMDMFKLTRQERNLYLSWECAKT